VLTQLKTAIDSTLNQKGRRIIIDYSQLANLAQIKNFDPMNVTMITPKMRIHTRSVKFAGGNFFTADFSQAVVEDLENKRYITVIPENEIQSVVADGETQELSKTLAEKRFAKSLSINAAKFKFEAVAGTVQMGNGEIIIKLSK
jgi:hypothetical protein